MTSHPVHRRKKLIEVAIPLEAINAASAREKSIRHGHPSTLHLWWARRPLAAARAVIFCQMVDDPSAVPEEFPTDEAQENERLRLFALISKLVIWENTTNEEVLEEARAEIRRSWRRACADNADHPEAAELFNPEKLPGFHDPFAGGGALPLEAQRLGLEAYASDLNPVAVLINKAMIEIPPKFAGMPPVNLESRRKQDISSWKGAQGLAEDVRYYGQWMRDEAEKRIGHLYPKVEVTAEMAKDRPDLNPYVGKKLTVIAWIWARTVKSPNPAFAKVEVPLASTFMLSTKASKEAYIEPVIEGESYRFMVKVGKPKDLQIAKEGMKLSRGNFRCLISGSPIELRYIRSEAQSGRLGERLMAIVAEGIRGRIYLSPTFEHEAVARSAEPSWKPDLKVPTPCHDVDRLPMYGMPTWGDAFTPRQLVALNTFSDLVQEARERVKLDALAAGRLNEAMPLGEGGDGAEAYADGLMVYLSFLVNQVANHSSSVCGWNSANSQMRSVFARQAISMTWDYAESNPLCDSSGSYGNLIERQVKGFNPLGDGAPGVAVQADAHTQTISARRIVSTDPPYYDNIGYADLSDFFWTPRKISAFQCFCGHEKAANQAA
jgi:putative DNA methylase